MKSFIIICLLLVTCTSITDAQKNRIQTAKQQLEEAWAQLKRSKDTTIMLITRVKQLSSQKVVYRTKLVERTDTVWRIDTCITVLQPIDSATIALYFRPRDTARETKIGRIIRYIFHKKVRYRK
jgi:hypothetical protein